jgi:two-component system, LytTR family, sensor kinase
MIKQLSRFLLNRWTRNALFWMLIAFLHYYPRTDIGGYLALFAIVLIIYGIPVYMNNCWLIPRFLLKRKYGAYGGLFILLLSLTTVNAWYAHSWIARSFPQLNFFTVMRTMAFPYYFLPNLLIFGIMALGKFLADALDNERKMEAYEQLRLESELHLLRAQINPHFLFNALNTIYGIARRKDNDTADAVLKLSDILRNNLYNGEKPQIGMEEEIRLIEQYVSFTLLRLKDKSRIDLRIEAAVAGQKIVPLILVTFIENAVKYGLENNDRSPAVTIDIRLEGSELNFTCVNSKSPAKPSHPGEAEPMGLRNVTRRLALCYPGKHQLRIDDTDQQYMVRLKMQLS